MAFRYKLRPFDPSDAPEALLSEILPQKAGSGPLLARAIKAPWDAVVKHLKSLGATCLLIQSGVRDPDFLEEHNAFYSKQHRAVAFTCVRVHAFALPFPASSADSPDILAFLDEAAEQGEAYLGFVTIRPLRHAPVGATILAPEPGNPPSCMDVFPVHIAGVALQVAGTPFLQQDNAVGACAQASIWMALRTLRRRVGNTAFSPAELTVAATRYLASDRAFPGRQGLTVDQMLEAVRSASHHPLHIGARQAPAVPATAQAVLAKASPYADSGLPVIAILFPPQGGHAVVAIGQRMVKGRLQPNTRAITLHGVPITYSMSSDWCAGLLIHNDNSGPYLSLESGSPSGPAYCLEHASSLIVPQPDGVFMTAEEAEALALGAVLFASLWFTLPTGTTQLPLAPFVLRPYLTTRHAFREWAKSEADLDVDAKRAYRTITLPKALWVVEIHEEALFNPADHSVKSRCGEIVLDAAADALHGDGLLFTRVTKDLWPSVDSFQALLLDEDDDIVRSTALSTGARCGAMQRPWL